MPQSIPDKPSGRRIVIVDDSDELRELYEMVLTSKGHEVRAAPLAEDALEIMRTWRPDLVLTDLFMPGMGGLELITRLRSDLAPPLPPIVVISGFPDAKAEALRRGATRFESKPLTPDELEQVVEDSFVTTTSPRERTDVVRVRRAATRAVGEAVYARHLTEDPGMPTRLAAQSQAWARFFDDCPAYTFSLGANKLELLAASSPTLPPAADLEGLLPLINDVVETAGSLVLTNIGSQWLAQQRGSPSIRFLVAVPFVSDHVAFGAFCLIDRIPRNFTSAELGILEYITRRGSAVLRGAPRLVAPGGLLDRAAFSAVLAGSVRAARETGKAFGLAILETTGIPSDGSLLALFASLPAPRLMVGILERRSVAAFAVGDSLDQVKERLVLVRRELKSRLTVTAIAELTYEDPVPRMEADSFIARAEELLVRAIGEATTAGAEGFMAINARRR